jgi:hypothetical protein
VNFDILVVLLMSEEESLISPLGVDKFTVKLEGTDKGLNSTGHSGLVHGIDVVESGVFWNGNELFSKLHVVHILSKFSWEKSMDIAVCGESQTEWNVVWHILMSTLIEAREVRETDLLDELGGRRELLTNLVQGTGGWWGGDMGPEVVREEVPVVFLTGDIVHGDKVGGVNSISKELETKSWTEWSSFTWLTS